MNTLWSRWASRPRSGRRGSAVTEFVVTAPLIVFVLFGTIEYGNYFSQLAIVTNAARDAARYASNQGTVLEARVQGAAVARILLSDVGFPCQVGGDCLVTSQIVQSGGVNLIEVEVVVNYDPVTHALPSVGRAGGGLGMPSVLRARGTYPLVAL